MLRNLLSFLLVLLLICGIVAFFSFQDHLTTSNITITSGELRKGMNLGKVHEITTKDGKVTVGSSYSQESMNPELTLSKWSDEAKMKLSYKIDGKPEAFENGILWKGKGQDLIYRQVPAKQPTSYKPPKKAIIQLAQANNHIRYIKHESIDLLSIAAAYELFEKGQYIEPVITSYVPNEDGYFFFGKRNARIDLQKPESITQPIARLKADDENFSCPVIPFLKNGGFIIQYYHPGVKNQQGKYFQDLFVTAINNTLEKHGVNQKVNRFNDFLYYIDGIRPVQIGRIGADTNNIILYLYTSDPFSSKLKDNIRINRLFKEMTFPSRDLNKLKNGLTVELKDEIISEFSNLANYKLSTSSLSASETNLLTGIKGLQKENDWDIEAERSDIPKENDPFDKFEFDILLHQKPSSNTFTYQIDTEGLDFIYQPELTEEEKNMGFYRPENVINSYAVYKKQTTNIYNNRIDADKYQTGKIMHIYRPKIIDKTGKSTWGQLLIDTTNKTLSVSVSMEWLENATYPVLVDPTFGYTTAGGSSLASGGSAIFGSHFSMPENGTPTKISVYRGVCFIENTPITMGDSSTKKIKDIKIGDLVKSFDQSTGTITTDRVVNVFRHSIDEAPEYYLSVTTSDSHQIGITPNHPVYTEGKWKAAEYLKEGDRLLNDNGLPITVKKIERISKKVPVYNLEIERNHNYFAHFLVHNKKGTTYRKAAIYDQSDNTQVATSDEDAIDNDVPSWKDYTLTTNPELLSGANYWLFFWTNASFDDLYFDSGGNGVNKSLAYGAWPDPITGLNTDNRMYSIYATYTANGTNPVNLKGGVNLKGNVNLK